MANTKEILTHYADDCAEVARAVESVAESARKVLAGPLTMRALCLLVRDNLPHGSKSRISMSDVQDVLEAAAGLDGVMVRKAKRAP